MVNYLQWGYGEMLKFNSILFLPSTTPLPPVDKRTNWVRGIPPSSISALFSPFPYSSDLCYSSSPSHTSTPFPHLCLSLHPSLCIFLFPSFYPHSISLHLLHIHYFPLSPFLIILFINVFLLLVTFVPLFIFIFVQVLFHFLFFLLLIFHSFHARYYHLNIPHNHLNPNHRSQTIQWLAVLMPLSTSICYKIVE